MVDSVALDVNHGFMFRFCEGNASAGRNEDSMPCFFVTKDNEGGPLVDFPGSLLVGSVAYPLGCLQRFVTPAID